MWWRSAASRTSLSAPSRSDGPWLGGCGLAKEDSAGKKMVARGFVVAKLAYVGGKPAGGWIGVDEEMAAAAIVDNLGDLSVRGLEAKG